jgi:hypothetical protein
VACRNRLLNVFIVFKRRTGLELGRKKKKREGKQKKFHSEGRPQVVF